MTKREIEKNARELIHWGLSDLNSPGTEAYEDMDGNLVESVFLGTVFGIMPSGKYYTPWANSNVDACPRCGGGGMSKLDRGICSYCDGLGSRDVYEDQLMVEALERFAERAGCYVESGEGDPCDIFMNRVVEFAEDREDYNPRAAWM